MISRSPKRTMDVLLERGRVIPTVRESVRARVLARAHSHSLTAAAAVERPIAVPATQRRGQARALVISAAFVVGAAAATATLRSREQPVAAAPSSHAEPAPCAVPSVGLPLPGAVPEPSVTAEPQRAERAISAQESYAAELTLLQRAQAAYQDRSFATTLLLVAEHRRRFPNGRLAEEREALRVKALAGAGRTKEAQRAASGFAARFPRSALLRGSAQQRDGGN